MGIVELYKDDFEHAANDLENASRMGGPDSVLTVNFKFRAWVELDHQDDVVTYCQQLFSRASDPTKIILYYWMGRALGLKGKFKEANADFDLGIALYDKLPSNQRDNTIMAYYALLEARGGKPKVALQMIEQVVANDSSSSLPHYWKARVLAIQGDKAKALSELAKAVAIRYRFSEIVDLDFLSMWHDQQFSQQFWSAIKRNTGAAEPAR